jgi:hypothetical protein
MKWQAFLQLKYTVCCIVWQILRRFVCTHALPMHTHASTHTYQCITQTAHVQYPFNTYTVHIHIWASGMQCQCITMRYFCNTHWEKSFILKAEKTNWGGRLSTVDLRIKIACIVKTENNIFNLKMSRSKLVSTRWAFLKLEKLLKIPKDFVKNIFLILLSALA